MQLVDQAVQVRAARVALADADVHESPADAAHRRASAFGESRADLIVVIQALSWRVNLAAAGDALNLPQARLSVEGAVD